MKSWIFGIVLIGLCVIQGVHYHNDLNQKKVDLNNSTKIENFWEKTEIELHDLQQFVTNDRCHINEKVFLACINSIVFSLQKSNFKLNANGIITEKLVTEHSIDSPNENKNLAQFLNLYAQESNKVFNFDNLWKEVLNLEISSSKKYTLALGINGYLSIQIDPHTYIGPTDYFTKVSSFNENSKLFIGLSFERKNQRVFIRKVFKNSDAEQAGLQNTDEIIAINDHEVKTMSLVEISELFKNNESSQFLISVQRGDSRLNKKIIRSSRLLSHVQAEVIHNNSNRIGYIQLSKFAYNVCDNVRTEIEKMNPLTLQGLILDLRDNSGGLLSEASCLGGLFIGENKKLFTAKYFYGLEDGLEDDSFTDQDQIYFGPMVILTNHYSASASELLAGALQEYSRATIIGETTFGKGSFQEIENWKGSSRISLFQTKGFYLLPSGETTQLKGVIPDIFLDSDFTFQGELDSYQFPIKYSVNKIQRVNQKLIYKNSYQANCNYHSIKSSSSDKFIARAEQVLGCKVGLSFKIDSQE